MKKFLSFALVVLLLFSLCIPAAAEGEEGGEPPAEDPSGSTDPVPEPDPGTDPGTDPSGDSGDGSGEDTEESEGAVYYAPVVYEAVAPAGSSVECVSASFHDNQAIFTGLSSESLNASLTMGTVIGTLGLLYERDHPGSVFASTTNSGAWYSQAMDWAQSCGLFTAEDGSVSAGDVMTRETLAYRLNSYLSLFDLTLRQTNLKVNFSDSTGFSSSDSRDAANVLQKGGVMIESADGCFYPSNPVSNSEFESIFLRFLQAVQDKTAAFRELPVDTMEASDPVDDSWFDDACFIGHSQVVGMLKYFNLDNADYYAVIGHTAQAVLDYTDYELPQGGFGSLRQGLENNTYGKVYIMLGINDCSDREDRIEEFKEPMREILDMVRETQPEAVIYLISLAPVGRSTSNIYIYNPENAILYTQAVKSLSREYNTEYLDLYRLMCDNDGYYLDEFNAGDGIHIVASMYSVILDYIRTHTVEK